ncbi:gamma-glutamyltranspeptidase/glutathione hydrolase [Mycobacterium frederiksbergense]|uniref:Gamma-glutamyltranspeptidase/glutathione hydrolase n=1 Tax=Mycolicibacterium frederiksbergense TaxID=117567 RepID=A0ABT6L4J0_9MYCO|nr:gamma-glutamyltransferase [Mycolicibacterium frederiksbergense]MDH6197850.1 gamma-glutamyltranspeptidase/glutathione hydrolase [Mycolicibacterium frederiksbergense]
MAPEAHPAPRPSALSLGGMVSSSHPAASFAGARVLAQGGNAIDATLAMAALTWLVLPGQCGIGGDAFAVVREPDGRVWTIGGSGFGPDGGTTQFYRDQGLSTIPLYGALGVTVPGAPAALAALHAHGASRGLPELWEPAARIAETGLACSAKTAADVREALTAIRQDPGLAAVYAPDGQTARVADRIAQPDLARTIRRLAHDPADFYTGEIAERAVTMLSAAGAPFSGDEWVAGATATPEAAITGGYAGATIHQTPLPTPGWMVLQQAALCDGVVGAEPWLGAGAIDRMARAARLAFQDRLERCGSDNTGWRDVLDPNRIAQQRRDLASMAEDRLVFSVRTGDTTCTAAVDADGRAVSFIHSLGFTFGATLTVPGTGVVLGNRLGRGAYLIPGHPNEVAPRRKPLNTLNAWIATGARGELLALGSIPGGDGQVQWNMQLLSHLFDHGLEPAAAVAAPRFTVFPGSDAEVIDRPAELRVEDRIGEQIRERLCASGHRIVVQTAYGAGGSAQVICRDERGVLRGAADPRQEGVAIGVD